MAQTYADRYARILAKLIDETIGEEKEFLSNGTLDDLSDYKFRAGTINGLRKCIELMEEADALLNGKERNP
jgi:hypothetical protein